MKVNRLLAEVERLKAEGQKVLATRTRDLNEVVEHQTVDPVLFTKWLMGCRNLLRILGDYAAPWNDGFARSPDYYGYSTARTMSATLEAIGEAIQNGLLVRLEGIAIAETFDSLLEQAEYLLGEGYFLAAGVLSRAVLEEHLRTWCKNANCFPSKSQPTLGDYNAELYKAKEYDVAVMKHVDSMVAIGNDAAHNKAGLDQPSVGRLLRDLRDFLGRHPNA
jgi:hypothetical protein